MAPNLSRPSETAPHYKWSPSYSSSSTANDHPRHSKLTTHGRVQFTASKQDPSPQSACPAASPPLNNKANNRRLQTSHPRGIKSLDGSICAFGGREVVDYRDVPVKGGLFPDEVAYNEVLVSKLLRQTAVCETVSAQLRADNEVVLTHDQLRPGCIIVRPGLGVVGIVGWENVGYCPEYLEFVAIFRGVDPRCGYSGELLNVFPQRYDAEFAVDQVITRRDTNAVGCCGGR